MAHDPTLAEPEGFFARVAMGPIHFAVFGLFLGVMLVHVSTTAILLLSHGIAAFLNATSDLFGWQQFVDQSDYAGTLATIDMTLAILSGGFAAVAFCVDIVRRHDLGREAGETEAAEKDIGPVPALVVAITILGWGSLSFVAAGIVLEFPDRLIRGTLDVFRIMASIAQFEIGPSLLQRIHDIEYALGFLIYFSAWFFYARAKERQITASQQAAPASET